MKISRALSALFLLFGLQVINLMTVPAQAKKFTLKSIQQNIEKDYQSVKHIGPTELYERLNHSSFKDIVIFDVREAQEYAVSHLSGAKQISPSLSLRAFLKNYREAIKGKTVVFYCSVGVRSSKMAGYLQQELQKIGVKQVYNLKQGIFGWANKDMPMVSQQQKTRFVHPYNSYWGQLLKSKDLWKYKP